MRLRDAILLGAPALFASVDSLASENKPSTTYSYTTSDSRTDKNPSSNKYLRTSVDEETNQERLPSTFPHASQNVDIVTDVLAKVSNEFAKHDDEVASTLLKLRNEYPDDLLTLYFEAGKKFEPLRERATELQNELMKTWKSEGMSSETLVKKLKRTEESDEVISGLAYATLEKYNSDFDPTPQKSKLDTLLNVYFKKVNPEKLAKFEKLDNPQLPDLTYKFLKLNLNSFGNPDWDKWLGVVSTIASKTSDDPEKIVIDTLRLHVNGDKELVELLDKSRASFGHTKRFKYVEESLLKRWVFDNAPRPVVQNYGNGAFLRYLAKIRKMDSDYLNSL